jgi:cytidylate kinase
MTSDSTITTPWHGYRGSDTPGVPMERPRGLTVSISRQAGARGSTIAKAVGQRLGWQVYSQEMLDFLAHDEQARQEVLQDLPPEAIAWAQQATLQFQKSRQLPREHDGMAAAGLIFALAARGSCVLVGRGAGFILPLETTVHVRIQAPLEVRTAYLAQWLRKTEAEARAEAAKRDQQRAQFLAVMSQQAWEEPTAYDLWLNSARLTVETAAELIGQVVLAKQQKLERLANPSLSSSGEFGIA